MITIVVAAGASRRFGWANKLLAPAPRRPLIAVTLTAVLAATDGPVVLVVGHQSRALLAALARHGPRDPRLHVVRNRHARLGLAQSLGSGLRAAPRLGSCVAIHLADMPSLPARRLSALRRALHHGATAARPDHAGQPGHPVCFRRALLDETPDPSRLPKTLAGLPAERFARLAAAADAVRDVDRRQMIRTLI